LEDAQRAFQEKQQQGEAEFQIKLAPVVEQVAKQLGIGLILRATPGLTFVLDPALDISPAVIEAFNQSETAPPPAGAEAKPPQPEN
jgi:Skp family chaperone for outer membrane proteins